MYPGGGGGQQQSDQTANFFWMLCIVFGVMLVFWWVDEKYIVIPAFWLRVHEIDAMRFLAQLWIPVAHLLHIRPPQMKQLDAMQFYMQNVKPSHVGWKKFAAINTDVGKWTRYPVIVIFLALAVLCYMRGIAHFRHNYSMRSLRDLGQEAWPQITPVVTLDLVKIDIDTGPWAMAQLPIHFSRIHDLLSTKMMAGKKVWVLKQKPAYRLFALQLGSLWKDVDALPIHIKALMLIFLCRAANQRATANIFLSQIAKSAASGKLDFTGVVEKFSEFREHRIIKWLEKRHAYTGTIMASLLEIARSDGVLATAEFLWLKPVDRRLWYTLNSVGRRTAVVEVAGVYAHWKAEKRVGRALKTPTIKSAVDALDESLQNILFQEESDQWRSSHSDSHA